MSNLSLGRWLRRAALTVLLGLLALAALTASVLAQGEAAMERSDAAFNEGDLPNAVLHARTAATLYAPGAPHVSRAYDRLTAVAVGAEVSGQKAIAQAAWSAIRAAALETRHLHVSRPDVLERANRSLSRLSAQSPAAEGTLDGRKQALEHLSRDEAPRAHWVLVLALGFTLAAAGIIVIASKGVTADGGIIRRWAVYGLLMTAIGAACWTLAVLQA
jgi:hypothetical protein